MQDIKILTDLLEDYLEEFEDAIIEKMSERLEEIDDTDPDDLKTLMKLQNINEDLEEMAEESEEMIDKAEPEIYNIIEGYARAYYGEAAERSGVDAAYEENGEIRRIVEETKRLVMESLKENLDTDRLGFTDAEGEFTYYEQGYHEVVNEAIVEVMR